MGHLAAFVGKIAAVRILEAVSDTVCHTVSPQEQERGQKQLDGAHCPLTPCLLVGIAAALHIALCAVPVGSLRMFNRDSGFGGRVS